MSNMVPEGWQIKPIGELVTLQYGKSPKEVIAEDGQYPVIGTGGITGFASSYLYDGCTTVIGRKGTINKPSYIEGKFWAIDTTYFGTCYKEAEPKWFYYSLQSFDLSKYNEASGVPSLGRDTLNAIPLLAPPLPEQKKIAAILSSVDEVIEKTRAQIDKLKDLKTGMMQELLTKGIGPGGVPHTEFKDSPVGRIPASWEVADLISLSLNGISNGVFNDPKKVGKGKKIINVYDMYQGFGVNTASLKLVDIDEKEFSRNQVEYGDVFFTRSSLKLEGIAYCNINLSKDNDITYDGHLMRVRPDKNRVHPKYLAHFCLSDHSRKFFMAAAKHSTMTTIGQADIASLKIALPPLSEQEEIISVISAVECRIKAVNTRLHQKTALKKALMQDLLTGKIRVQVDTRELADA